MKQNGTNVDLSDNVEGFTVEREFFSSLSLSLLASLHRLALSSGSFRRMEEFREESHSRDQHARIDREVRLCLSFSFSSLGSSSSRC